MTTPSEAAVPALAAVERRLHPLSWLFLLLQQLRQFALPLVALLLFGRGGGEWLELVGALGAVLIALHAVLQYLTYRFRIAGGELTIRSGVLQRNVRHIPLQRIQNVALRRNLLHRLAGVAEVRLESAAGSARAEAQMRVLSLADAAALEALVRASRDGATPERPAAAAPPLVALPLGELVRLGLASNRGMVLVAAAVGALSQVQPGGFGRRVHELSDAAMSLFRSLQPDSHWLPGALVLVAAVLLLLRGLSVAMVLLRLYGFELREHGERLSVEAGLLTRHRGHAARRKVQRWLLQDNVWLRMMDRRTLRIETAAVRSANDGDSLTELVPIARTAELDRLLRHWLPALDWPAPGWQPLHRSAWRRFALLPVVSTVLAVPVLVLQHGTIGLAGLLLVPLWLLRAVRLARFSGWACDGRHLVWRTGWLARQWHLVEVARVQLLRVEQSPFDRRRGMASLLVDTAGAHPGHPPLRLRHLPVAVAQALAAALLQRAEPGTGEPAQASGSANAANDRGSSVAPEGR